MLVEIEGERARVFAGLAMRMRLLQILGPVRALRMAQAVARMGGPVLGVDWGRRDFLRRAGGALLGLLTLQGPGAPLRSGTAGPPIPSQSRPPSRRRVQRGEPIYEALFRRAQTQFRPERWNAEPDWNEVWLYTFEQGSALVTSLSTSGPSHRFLTAPARGEEILTLYVAEIEWRGGSTTSARMRLYDLRGKMLLDIELENGRARRQAPVQSSKAPGHAKDVARPKQDVCCNWLALNFCIDGVTIGCVGCCFANPALFAACLATGTAACFAANCWFC
jgi:hypothetical protein